MGSGVLREFALPQRAQRSQSHGAMDQIVLIAPFHSHVLGLVFSVSSENSVANPRPWVRGVLREFALPQRAQRSQRHGAMDQVVLIAPCTRVFLALFARCPQRTLWPIHVHGFGVCCVSLLCHRGHKDHRDAGRSS